ncbi:MAG: TetR family transcriptional regulator [Betaproteobacteria bacterium]|nr:TetR family transcriptional regulator [Betaproteobacteria bacterium]
MDVRTRILDAALALAAEAGLHALTQPRVSRAAGVRQSHLTYYFPTRAALLQAVALRSIESASSPFGHRLAKRAAGRHTLADRLADAILDHGRVRLLLGLVAAADSDVEIRHMMRRFIRAVRARLAELLRLAGLRADVATVAGLHALIVGNAALYLARDTPAARRETRAVLHAALERLKPLRGG